MPYESILFDVTGGVARLTLNRPARFNSFTAAMHLEVRKALARVRADRSVRVLVLDAAGRGFCAGHDMSDMAPLPQREPDDDAGIVGKYFRPAGEDAQAGADPAELVRRFYAPLVLALRALPVPVIAAVNGVAAGAGANIALACDIVIAARSATFIQSFCKLGLAPDTGGTWLLPRLAGAARAAGLTLLGDKLGAEQAERWGLIWQCVDDDALRTEVDALAARFAQAATLGLARTKEALHASAGNTLARQLALECDIMQELGQSSDYREGIAAFAEKRAPNFIGHGAASTRRRVVSVAAPARRKAAGANAALRDPA